MIALRPLVPIALLVLSALAPAQAGARDRWEALSPEERAVLLDRFARFRRMSEAERAALVDRARELAALKQRLADALPPSARKSLKELPPEERRAVIRDHALLEARELARRVREALPPGAQRGLDQAGRRERASALAELRAKIRAEGGVAAIEHLGGKLGLSPAEIERLKGLALDARLDALMSLERKLVRRAVELGGLPPGVTPDQWDELEALSERDFFARWRELVPRSPGAGAARHRWIELDRLSRPGLDDLERLRELAPVARRVAIAELVRERCLQHVEQHHLLDEQALDELRQKRGLAFLDALRAAIRKGTGRPPAEPKRPPGD